MQWVHHAAESPYWQGGVAISIIVGGIAYKNYARKNRAGQDNNESTAPIVPSLNYKEQSSCSCLVVGAGTIGASFSAVYLARGMEVVCMDPFVSVEILEQRIRDYWPILIARGLTKLQDPPLKNRLIKTGSLDEALSKGGTFDFVQECTWENVENKQKVLGELDKALDPTILIASSTSFIPWQLLVKDCQHKYRIMIGHPTIPHLGCYMEIYGTISGWTLHCQKWYTAAGFDVVVMNTTIPGHVFNSFLRVNLQHGHSLVRQGVCSPEDVQKAMRHLGRSMYAAQFYLSLLMIIGGDRGVEGGKELGNRIKDDAIYLVLFSALKNRGTPDIFAKPFSQYVGRFISNHLLPKPPEEWLRASEQFEKDITQNGQITPAVAMHQASSEKYKLIPMEVGNDPFAHKSYQAGIKEARPGVPLHQ